MIVITDSNIFYSALVSPNGTVAKILKEKSNLQFTAPDYLIDEIKEHSGKIAKYLKKSKREVLKNFNELLQEVTIISVDEISKSNIKKAKSIVIDVDIDDAFFIALHLHTKHKIWTSDKQLIKGVKAKGYQIFITTEELKNKLYKK